MEIIELNDINLDELEKYKVQGTKSTVYHDGEYCIKILDGLHPYEKEILYKKLLEMDGMILDDVLMPKDLIVHNGQLAGYTMNDFKNSVNILDYLTSTRYIDCKYILKVVKEASLILKKIHEYGIICQDLSFDNILIDEDGNIKYSDIDGCAFKDYNSPYMSVLLKRFLIDYRKDKLCYVTKNMDRISFMLSFYYVIYLRELQKLSEKKYHSLSDNISTLENCREYANMLLGFRTLPEVPYLDELINDSDNYIIDRIKQISTKKKILYYYRSKKITTK